MIAPSSNQIGTWWKNTSQLQLLKPKLVLFAVLFSMHLWDRLKRYNRDCPFLRAYGASGSPRVCKNTTMANRLSFELLFVEIWSLKKSSNQVAVICYWCESAACCTSHLTFKNTVLLAKPPNGWWFSRVLHHLLSTLSISCFFFPCWWVNRCWIVSLAKRRLKVIPRKDRNIFFIYSSGFMWILIFCRLYLRPKTMQHFLAETM